MKRIIDPSIGEHGDPAYFLALDTIGRRAVHLTALQAPWTPDLATIRDRHRYEGERPGSKNFASLAQRSEDKQRMYQDYYRPPTQFSVFPPVIKNLLILNGLVFLAQMVPSTAEMLMRWFALWPLGIPDGPGYPSFWPWQVVSYSFLHGGFTHLLFNMFALWMFGVQIENSWGSNRFGLFYFFCVIGAGLIQLIVVTLGTQLVPTVGASGGVFGILLAFGMMFPNQPIYIYFLFPIKAKWLVIGYMGLELWAAVTGTQAGVANFAHLGGALFGFLMIQYWRGKLPIQPERTMRW